MSELPRSDAPIPRIAAFDFDGTLLRGDCLLLFHRQLKGTVWMLRDWIQLLPALFAWKCGLRPTGWFKRQALRVILTGTDPDRRQRVLQLELPALLQRRLRPAALARLEWHHRNGHQLLIISASPRTLIEPVARRLQAELIATETSDFLEANAGEFLQLTSPNCKGPEKISRLQAWFGGDLGSVDLHAYGDSRGDRELLRAASQPHWRSFGSAAVPYPRPWSVRQTWPVLMGLVLLGSALLGLAWLEPATRQSLLRGAQELSGWLPAIYAVLGLVYVGRFWRWRLLLGSVGVGRWSLQEARCWFQGFALTATPGKLGELSRVGELHRQLGYPRPPLVHVFLAERLCDGVGVAILLLLVAPASLLSRLAGLRSWLLVPAVLALLCALGALALRAGRRWRHHLPQGAMARACLPATAVTMAIWAGESVILSFLVQALRPATDFDPAAAIRVYLLSGTAGMLSSLPGGIGVNEAAATFLLSQAGLPAGIALTIAILRRLCTVWSVTLLALVLRLAGL